MVSGCHTCLRVINNSSEGFHISSTNSDPDENSLKHKLIECVPELLLDSTPNVLLCQSCVKSLSLAYEFKQRCLESQQKIYGYLQQMPFDTQINIGEIALYYGRMDVIAETEESKDVRQDELDSQISTALSTFTVKMPHNCALCKFSCVDKCTFRQHMILHNTKTAPYKCDECSLMLSAPELLLDHLAVHTNEKPYSCTLCDVLTSTHVELKEHGWTHRKPFQCGICWLRFAQKYDLQLHSKTHITMQSKKKFQCMSCDYKSEDTKVLENHINNNHKQQITRLSSNQPELLTVPRPLNLSQTSLPPGFIKKIPRKKRLNRTVKIQVEPGQLLKMKKRDAIKQGLLPEDA